MKIKCQAFTLAEIMIVLTVVGIMTAIILPAAINSSPNENVMKFKKANAALHRVIKELHSSDKYYHELNILVKPNGQAINDVRYFCECMADVLSPKYVSCKNSGGYQEGWFALDWDVNKVKGDILMKDYVDTACSEAAKDLKSPEIITSDNVSWYSSNPGYFYGAFPMNQNFWNGEGTDGSNYCTAITVEDQNTCKSRGFYYYIYKIYCLDVDGMNEGEAPFGYGIDYQGRIFMGSRAQEWMEKSITGN